MSNASFGEILRDARERQGLDLNSTARRLRIRPDILRAIERSDFAAMPPRGYARNMVNGYARFLGLNSTEITGMYLDELYDYQQKVSSSAKRRDTGFIMPTNAATERSARRNAASRTSASSRVSDSDNGYFGESSYDFDGSSRSGRVGSDSSRPSLMDRFNYSGGSPDFATELKARLPYIIGGILALLLVFFFISRLFSCATPADDTDTIPVTGVEETSQTENTEDTTTASTEDETPPTSAVFEFTVAEGEESYIEVYVDGGDASVNGTIAGKETQSFEFTKSLHFVCSDKSAVKATVDGEAIELKDNANGIVDETIQFSDILAAWAEAHPNVSVDLDSTSSDSTDSDSSTDTSTSTSTTDSDSSTSASTDSDSDSTTTTEEVSSATSDE